MSIASLPNPILRLYPTVQRAKHVGEACRSDTAHSALPHCKPTPNPTMPVTTQTTLGTTPTPTMLGTTPTMLGTTPTILGATDTKAGSIIGCLELQGGIMDPLGTPVWSWGCGLPHAHDQTMSKQCVVQRVRGV